MTFGASPENAFAGKRVAFVTTVGTTLNFFSGHIRELVDLEATVDVVAGSPPDSSLTNVRGVRYRHIDLDRKVNPWVDIKAIPQLYRVFARNQYDVIVAATPKATFFSALCHAYGPRLSQRKRPALVICVFGLRQMTLSGPARVALDQATRLTTRLADSVWFDSHSLRRYATTRRLSHPDKAFTAANGSVDGVDPTIFNPDASEMKTVRDERRAALGIEQRDVVLGYVGRITKDKGLMDLLEALGYIDFPANGDSIGAALHTVLIGNLEGDAHEIVQAASSVPNVHILPPTTDVPGWLSTFDIFVMPSHREGFGVVNLEAAAMRLPVVSTRIPGCLDSVADGSTGLLVKPGAPNSLGGAISLYACDPSLRKVHGTAGRARAIADFSPAVVRESVRLHIASILDSSSRA